MTSQTPSPDDYIRPMHAEIAELITQRDQAIEALREIAAASDFYLTTHALQDIARTALDRLEAK